MTPTRPGTARFDQLVDRARLLVADGNRAVLGITGAPGAGKTTLADQLDEVWYVDLDADERLRRLIARHVR